MNEAEERKLYEDWLHQSPEFADTIISAWDVWLGRAALAQPEPAAPTVVEPLTWKPILPGDGLPEWRVADGGKRINSEDFHFDAALSVHGDFGSDEERQQYAEILAAKLNAATPPRAALTDEQIDAIVRRNVTITDQNLAGALYMSMRELEAAHGIEE